MTATSHTMDFGPAAMAQAIKHVRVTLLGPSGAAGIDADYIRNGVAAGAVRKPDTVRDRLPRWSLMSLREELSGRLPPVDKSDPLAALMRARDLLAALRCAEEVEEKTKPHGDLNA